jgi:hypothetical protein
VATLISCFLVHLRGVAISAIVLFFCYLYLSARRVCTIFRAPKLRYLLKKWLPRGFFSYQKKYVDKMLINGVACEGVGVARGAA